MLPAPPGYPPIPTLSQKKMIAEGPLPVKNKDGEDVIITRFTDGTSEYYHYDSDKLAAEYEDGTRKIRYTDRTVVTTSPGKLKKVECAPIKRKGKLQKSTYYYKIDPNKDENRFIVNDFLDDHISIVDKDKNKLTHFYRNGRVHVYKNGKLRKQYPPESNVLRQILPDDTQIKEYEQGSLITTKDLGSQTKIAEYITPEGESISLLKKNFDTGEVDLLIETSDIIKSDILKKTKFSEQAIAAMDSYLGPVKGNNIMRVRWTNGGRKYKKTLYHTGIEIIEYLPGNTVFRKAGSSTIVTKLYGGRGMSVKFQDKLKTFNNDSSVSISLNHRFRLVKAPNPDVKRAILTGTENSKLFGTELKQFVKENLLIVKNQEGGWKYAEIMKDEMFVPFLQKDLNNKIVTILADLSKVPEEAKNILLKEFSAITEGKFSKIAKETLKALKKLNVL